MLLLANLSKNIDKFVGVKKT